MTKKLLPALAFAVLLASSALSAQTGTVRYDRSVQRTFERPEGLPAGGRQRPADAGGAPQRAFPGGANGEARVFEQYSVMTLRFDGESALTTVEPGAGPAGALRAQEGAAGLRGRAGAGAGAGGLPTVGAGGFGGRGAFGGMPIELMKASWVSPESGQMVETVEFMTRTFRIERARPEFRWQLVGEESEYLGYVVQKATTEQDGQLVEAWFTMEIPVSAGPGIYTGLPGVILMVSVDRGATLIQAVDVDLESAVQIAVPSEGDRISEADFDKLVEEKTEEFRNNLTGRAGARRGGGGQ